MSTPLDARVSKSHQGGPSYSLGHRLFRLSWGLVWALFGSWTPVPLHFWRRMLLTLFGARIDNTARVYPGVQVWYPPNLEMHAYTCLGPNVICYCMDRITLEQYAVVSQRAHLCGGTHDPDDPYFQLTPKPIHIGARAWIAAEAFVGPGVIVGADAVLGARGVAVKNMDAGMIYGGNPAKALRVRLNHD